jgi:hypothetical protein
MYILQIQVFLYTLPPKRAGSMDLVTPTRIFNGLATRFDVPLGLIHQHDQATSIEQWGKVQCLDGGDTMIAASLVSCWSDSQGATFVRMHYSCVHISVI